MTPQERHAAFAAVLSGRPGRWPCPTRADLEAFEREAERQGVGPLIVLHLSSLSDLPPGTAERWSREAAARTAADLCLEAALREALAALADAGIPAVLFKGAALAWTLYPRPDLRPRLDTDLLVRPEHVDLAGQALQALGYVPAVQAGTEAVLYQRPYARVRDEVPHVIDLHWRLLNPSAFAPVGSFDELFAESVPVPALGPSARATGMVHAMVVACVHRVAHHYDDDRLVWLYDIHLLAGRLDPSAWRRVAALARERGVFEVCRASLKRASECLGTVVPADILDASVAGEATARYLSPSRSHARVVFEDIRDLPGWRDRLQAMRSHLLPPASYMRQVYAPDSSSPLAWLYARRAVTGARRWLGSSRAWGA